MLSILLQLLGGLLLSWNAITKTINSRAFEGKLIVPNSTQLEPDEAIEIQKRYFLNIFGFVILSGGYFLQLIKFDFLLFDPEESFLCTVGSISLSILFVLLIFLSIKLLSKKTAPRLIELSKGGAPGKTIMFRHSEGKGSNENT